MRSKRFVETRFQLRPVRFCSFRTGNTLDKDTCKASSPPRAMISRTLIISFFFFVSLLFSSSNNDTTCRCTSRARSESERVSFVVARHRILTDVAKFPLACGNCLVRPFVASFSFFLCASEFIVFMSSVHFFVVLVRLLLRHIFSPLLVCAARLWRITRCSRTVAVAHTKGKRTSCRPAECFFLSRCSSRCSLGVGIPLRIIIIGKRGEIARRETP